MVRNLILLLIFFLGAAHSEVAMQLKRTGEQIYRMYPRQSASRPYYHLNAEGGWNDAEENFMSTCYDSDAWLQIRIYGGDNDNKWAVTDANIFDWEGYYEGSLKWHRFNIKLTKGNTYYFRAKGHDGYSTDDFIEMEIYQVSGNQYQSIGKMKYTNTDNQFTIGVRIETTNGRGGSFLSAGVQQRFPYETSTTVSTATLPYSVNTTLGTGSTKPATDTSTASGPTNGDYWVYATIDGTVLSRPFSYAYGQSKTDNIDGQLAFTTIDATKLNFRVEKVLNPQPITGISATFWKDVNTQITDLTQEHDYYPSKIKWSGTTTDETWISLTVSGNLTLYGTDGITKLRELPFSKIYPREIATKTFTNWEIDVPTNGVGPAGSYKLRLDFSFSPTSPTDQQPYLPSTPYLFKRTAPILTSVAISASSPYGTPTELTVGWSAPVNWLAS